MRFSVCIVLLALISSIAVSAFPKQYRLQVIQDDMADGYIRPQDYVKRRTQLRNCFLSPVQCLLPVDNQRFNKFHKRFFK